MTSQQLSVVSSRPGLDLLGRVLSTTDSISPVALRVSLALAMFPHGAQKLLGWFGGYGWSGTMDFFTGQMGLPSPVAAFTILLEFFGPLLLLAGIGTRAVALGFVGIMVGAIATVHGAHGFFMNWSGQAAGEGFEYHLLVIGMALALVFAGGGRWSIDRRVGGRR